MLDIEEWQTERKLKYFSNYTTHKSNLVIDCAVLNLIVSNILVFFYYAHKKTLFYVFYVH